MTRPLIYVGVRGDFSMFNHIASLNNIRVLGVLDKYYYGNTDIVDGIPVIGSEDWLLDPANEQANRWREDCDFIVTSFWSGSQHLNDTGLNNEQLRIERCDLVDQAGVNVINLIDPDIYTTPGNNLKLGRGSLICCLAGLNRKDIVIGDHCEIDAVVSIGHNTTIGRNVIIGAQTVIGKAIIEDNVRIGVHCTVVSGGPNNGSPLTIGTGSSIWMGTTVFKDVPRDSMVVPSMPRIVSKQRVLNKSQ